MHCLRSPEASESATVGVRPAPEEAPETSGATLRAWDVTAPRDRPVGPPEARFEADRRHSRPVFDTFFEVEFETMKH